MHIAIGRKRLVLNILVFIGIVAFGLVLVSRFNSSSIHPSSNPARGSNESPQTEQLQQTDKTEIAQTDLIGIEPSEAVVKAERAMPPETASSYYWACKKMKHMYIDDQTEKTRTENDRFNRAWQDIINKYNREGRSFSSDEKQAQVKEQKRHHMMLGQITDKYNRHLNKLKC